MHDSQHAKPTLRYLFIHFTNDLLGGIETLIGRMAHYLVSQGHEVSVLTTSAKRWRDILPASVRCVELEGKFRDLFYPAHIPSIWSSTQLSCPDVIKTFDLPTSWCGSLLIAHLRGVPRLVSGIYNPYVFDQSKGQQVRLHGWKLYLRNYLENIPAADRIVCDVEIQKELSNIHGTGALAQFWPIPIDGTRFNAINRKPKFGHLVSIGRLAAMKEYNFYMIDVVQTLRTRGYDVRWTVYGSGAYEEEMKQRIITRKLSAFIELRGDVDYAKFGEALEDAYVFVGMGTSILEASFCRVPNVLALAYDQTGVTYGPIYRMPFGRVGQLLDEQSPNFRVEDEIERILKLSPSEYATEEERVREYVLPYDLTHLMADFEVIVSKASPPRRDTFLYYQNYAFAFARIFGLHLDQIF